LKIEDLWRRFAPSLNIQSRLVRAGRFYMQNWPPVYDASYHPKPDQDYWFPEIETMDPEKREQTIILPKLQQQLTYAYENSAFYRKKWYAAGVNDP
jgi:hypothetical protein